MAAYTRLYHSNKFGCCKVKDSFWGNDDNRRLMTKFKYEEHDSCHRQTCFKKGCECRALFPKRPTKRMKIEDDPTSSSIKWHNLVSGKTSTTRPWLIYPKRPLGCEYVNQHSNAISEIFNCNSNVQVGDPSHVFYSTLYTSKSTQAEDSERQHRIASAIIRRIISQEEKLRTGEISQMPSGCCEGISRLLSGMNASTCRDVVSAPMSHLLMCQQGKRFKFSHNFGPLLVSHMEDTLLGVATNCIVRKTRVSCKRKNASRTRSRSRKTTKEIVWFDSTSNDYLFRPSHPSIDNISFYQFTMEYEKKVQNTSKLNLDPQTETFQTSHPGFQFSWLSKRNLKVIPLVYYDYGQICPLEELETNNTSPEPHVERARERYAKTALLMFYPFRTLDDLQLHGSYWKRFRSQLRRKKRNKSTKFWDYGFNILQNIEDRLTMQRHSKRAVDNVTRETKCSLPDEEKSKSKRHNGDDDGAIDINDLVSNM